MAKFHIVNCDECNDTGIVSRTNSNGYTYAGRCTCSVGVSLPPLKLRNEEFKLPLADKPQRSGRDRQSGD